MDEIAFAIPGDLALPTGGYVYARRLIAALAERGVQVRRISLSAEFPHPSRTALALARAAFAAVPVHMPLLVDGLAFGALPAALLDAVPRRYVVLVHHPLALETGLPAARAAELAVSEAAALSRAGAVIATSLVTAENLAADYGVSPDAITVAVPGIDPAPRARGMGGVPRILAVGAIVPRKGFDRLADALARCTTRPWTCRIVGSTERDPGCAEALGRRIEAAGLQGRVILTGALSDAALAAEWDAADLYALTSHHEGFGMAAAEALSRGIPVIAAAGGAPAAWLPRDACRFAVPGDVGALAAAIRDLLEPGTRRAMSDAAWAFGRTLPRWEETAARVAAVLRAAAQSPG